MIRRYFNSWIFLLTIWLFVGFTLGTLILLFPLRWAIDAARQSGYSVAAESTGIIVAIIFLISTSFGISWWLFRSLKKKDRFALSSITLFVLCVCFIGALSLMLNPDVVNRDKNQSRISERFTIGPYPTEQKIKSLKDEGYTSIITLLHPAVVPFEPALLKAEEEATQKHKIELVKAPMLPWISDNAASLEIIEDILKRNEGKYYIHCYLGKDRVNVVKNLISNITGDSSILSLTNSESRTFEQMKAFERGDIFKLGSDVYMTPFPTDEEFLAFFLAGRLKTVVNLMDSTIAENKPWIAGERRELSRGLVVFKNFTINPETGDDKIGQIIDSIQSYPKPIVIHHWNTIIPESRNFRRVFSRRSQSQPLNLRTGATESF